MISSAVLLAPPVVLPRAPEIVVPRGGDPPQKWGLAGQGLAWDLAEWPRVCWLSPEPQGTPKPTFLPPNGSPCHHFGHGDRAQTQNCGAVLTRGVPPPQSRFFFDPFLTPKIGKCQFLGFFRNCAAQLRANLGPMGPHGPHGAPILLKNNYK